MIIQNARDSKCHNTTLRVFEVGKQYYTHSICDRECIYTILVLKRTAKTLTILQSGQERRTKIFYNSDGEYVRPDRYSMAPIFYAHREYTKLTDTSLPM